MKCVVSVIVPTYNRASMLLECVKSVQRQTYRPIELIVVDDGSTDNSCDIVEQFAERYSSNEFVVILHRQKNSGAPSARNLGVGLSTGAYIQFLDSDDFLYPEAIKMKAGAIEETSFEYVYSISDVVDEDLHIIGSCGLVPPVTFTGRGIARYFFDIAGPLISRKAMDAVGSWDEELNGAQEIEFFSRLKHRWGLGLCLSQRLHAQRRHNEGNISLVGSSKHAHSSFVVLKKMQVLIDTLESGKDLEGIFLSSYGCDVANRCRKAMLLNEFIEAISISSKYGPLNRRLPFQALVWLREFAGYRAAVHAFVFLRTLRVLVQRCRVYIGGRK